MVYAKGMKPTPEIDRQVYELAKGYLPSLGNQNVTPQLIDKYTDPMNLRPHKLTSREELYLEILFHAQNTGMKSGVIGGAIGGVKKLGPVLCEFNPHAVLAKYEDDWKAVLDQIKEKIKPIGKIRETSRSIWPQYCRTILSAAKFIDQFNSAEDFYEWVNFFDHDDRARASLPMLLDHEIEGFGFALSCDFLKELGYVNFPKPDTHLKDIFSALELCEDAKDQYKLFKAIIRVANHADVTPYAADKVFWLIGSGKFYADKDVGDIGGHKQEFIKFAKSKISKGK